MEDDGSDVGSNVGKLLGNLDSQCKWVGKQIECGNYFTVDGIEKSLQNILTKSGGPVGLVEGETDGWLVSVAVGFFEGKAVDGVVGFGVDIVKGDTVGLGDRGFVMAGEKVGADGIVVSVSVGIDGLIVGLGVGVVDDCFSLGRTPKVQK